MLKSVSNKLQPPKPKTQTASTCTMTKECKVYLIICFVYCLLHSFHSTIIAFILVITLN